MERETGMSKVIDFFQRTLLRRKITVKEVERVQNRSQRLWFAPALTGRLDR